MRPVATNGRCAPWLDIGMVARGEVAIVQPFAGVAFYVAMRTPAFVATDQGIAIAQKHDGKQAQ